MDTTKIAEFLKALRKAKGYTQEEVAQKLYLSPKTISRWESANGIPDINIISAVADLYGVTVDEILKGERVTERTENRSDQTKKLKEESGGRALYENIVCKLNPYLIASIITLCAGTVISLIIFVFIAELGVVLIPFILIVACIIMAIGNSDVRRRITDGYEQGYCRAMDRAKSIVRRKNLLFADVAALAVIVWLITLAAVFRFFTVHSAMFIAVAVLSYIFLRVALTACNTVKERNVVFNIISALLYVQAMLCLLNVSMIVKAENVTAEYTDTLIAFTYINSEEWNNVALKAVSASLLALSVVAAVCGAIFRRWWVYPVAAVLGIAANVAALYEQTVFFGYVDPFAVISLIFAIVFTVITALQERKIRKSAQ